MDESGSPQGPTSADRDWDVVVVGGINTDFVVLGRELPGAGMSLDGAVFREGPGGKGANAAVTAARLGARTALVGRVGGDDRGRALRAALAAEQVHIASVASDEAAATGAAVIQVDASGQKQILAALGANLRLDPGDIDAAGGIIRSSRVLLMQLEVPVHAVLAAARMAHAARVQIVLDPAPPRDLPDELIALVDVIRANATEIEALSGRPVHDRASARVAARALLSRGVGSVIAGAGSGNLLVWASGEAWLPEFAVDRVDPTGAGDAFSAALAVALAEGQPLRDAGRFASAAAALATTALGAQAGLSGRRDIERLLDGAEEKPG